MADKKVKARIKISKLVEESVWRFIDERGRKINAGLAKAFQHET